MKKAIIQIISGLCLCFMLMAGMVYAADDSLETETEVQAVDMIAADAETDLIDTDPVAETVEVEIETEIVDIDVAAVAVPQPVTGLKATGSGRGKVTLSWNASPGAEGYLIYGQKQNQYGYVGMTTMGTTFTDAKALTEAYNFYWCFPYVKDAQGKMVCGGCAKYVFAKGICSAVANLKAASVRGGVQLSWAPVRDAEGYLVYGIVDGKPYGYLGMTTKGTTYIDVKASSEVYNYYWVYPYFKSQSGTMVVGGTAKYTYGRAKSSGIAAPSVSGRLNVKGTQLVGADGRPVQLKGISTHGLAWFPGYVNNDSFHEFRYQWDVNVMRLAMYTAEYGGYCSGGDQTYLKKLVKQGVNYAINNDMYVIIDWHILSDNNPNTNIQAAKAFFADMAKTYAGKPNVIYEICNEPNGGTSWKDIKRYAEQIISTIRTYDQKAIIIVGTPNWSQYVDQAAADPIKGYSNIMYTLHFYADTHRDDLRNKMINAVNAGLPIFVTEYGICDASGSGAINTSEANKWIQTMNQYGISYVAWNLSNKGETSAILKPSCQKTSGFTTADLSASGLWLYHMLQGE